MRLGVLSALGLCVLASGAFGQSADVPVISSSTAELLEPADSFQELTRILVLGDAVGGGLGAGLMRMAEIEGRYDVSIRFNEESGLARPEVYDWTATVPKILASNQYDVIVVLMGTNDRQMIKSENARFAFNTAEWSLAYTKLMDELLGRLGASGARIFWVSIPPMADREYDADMQVISKLQRARVEAWGFSYLDIRKDFTTAEGEYTDTGRDENGEVRRLRGKDGVSFFKSGNNRMGQIVLAAIEASKTVPSTENQRPNSAASEAPRQPQRPLLPVFGQTLLLGETVTFVPEDVVLSAVAVAGTGEAAALETLRAMSPEGSGAEKLFRLGDPPPAPTGRIDDFSAPPSAD